MEDYKLNFDEDKELNLPSQNSPSITPLNIRSSDDLLGVDLLANNSRKMEDTGGGGYSSGEESVKSLKVDNTNSINFVEEKIDMNLNDNVNDTKEKNIQIDENMMNVKSSSDEFKPIHSLSPNDIKNEKIDLIYKFKRLESQGIRTTMNYNMNSQLEDMRNEYLKLKMQRQVDNSIKFQRKVMMALVTGAEFLNNKFDPFNIKLDGWSESVNDNINDFDEVFEELYLKYGGGGQMAPEIRLVMLLAGSGFMFHLQNTLFKSSMPGMDDIMKQNPDLMKQFAKAAVGSMANPQQQREPEVQPNLSQNRPEMSGPAAGLDDLINQMNLQPNNIPDLDSVSIISGDTDKNSNTSGRITLNL